MTLLNVEGKIIQMQEIENLGAGNISFDLSTIESGIYFAALKTENGIVSTHKIVKE